MVVSEPEPAVGFGGGDEQSGLVVLAAVDVEECRGGLEVGAGEAGVGVGAVLLGVGVRSSRWAGWCGRGSCCWVVHSAWAVSAPGS